MDVGRPFRFGIVSDRADSREEWIEQARKAEDSGYATILVPDHFVTDFSPIVALMSAADATRTLRVGSFVFANDFRHPAVLAKDAATLDVLSGGRLEFGIGAGWHPGEYERAGLQFDPPGVRINRLEEALQIIKSYFSEAAVNFAGQYYTVKNLEGLPKPVQRPYPPLFIGGGGKRVLGLAAREANIIGVHYQANNDGTISFDDRTGAALARKVAWIRQIAGERFNTIELNLLTAHVEITNHPDQAIERVLAERKWTN